MRRLDSSTLAPSEARGSVMGREAEAAKLALRFWLAALDDFRNWLIQEAA
jgi:hypothetical protein